MNLDKYIEHLQEMGKVVITDENITELQQALKAAGYETKFVSLDRDYLVLVD